MSDLDFVKLMTFPHVKELISTHPLAFAILSLAAVRARWSIHSISKLEIGEAMIGYGDFEGKGKGTGMTHREYRTNLNKLVNSGFATIKTTNQGTLIKIINTDIYDVSRKRNDTQNDNQSTSKRQLTENIEGRRTKNPKPKKSIRTDSNAGEAKLLFLDRVYLTQKQHDELQAECGDLWPEVLARLNNYIPNKPGEPYKCHASAIRQWVIARVREDAQRKKKFGEIPKQPSHMHPKGAGASYPKIESNEENL